MQTCSDWDLRAEQSAKFSIAPLSVFFGVPFRVHSEITQPVAQRYSRAADFHAGFPEAPVPGFVLRIVAERVIRGAVLNAEANSISNVVAIVESPARSEEHT